jgi:protein-L-isoaspartate(D-aspartate) O-methyltransferase
MSLRDKKEFLIRSLSSSGWLRSPQVIRAFREVPREGFVRPGDREHAYADEPIPIGNGQTISAPHMVAIMTELLKTRRTHTVLEVGCGSGYQAAILSGLVRKVYSIELEPALAAWARKNLRDAGISNVEVVLGDGSLGLPEHAPYDRIIVTCGSDRIYPAWEEQLKEGGIMLVPRDSGAYQDLVEARKVGGRLKQKAHMQVVFVPLRH